MATPRKPITPPLKGSEQHFPLKNDPGKKGDPDHAETDAQADQSSDEK